MPYTVWKALAAVLLAAGVSAQAHADSDLAGAGSSFVAPLVEAWAPRFKQQSAVQIDYRVTGSGEGIRLATTNSVDFAMTDVPLTEAELAQGDLLQFPVVAAAIVPVVNLPGVDPGELKLTGPLLADIYLGKITTWDAPAIRELNPGLSLPVLPIKVVHRSEGSGTSFVFTYYLSQVSPAWQERLGVGSRLRWPTGIAERGNGGVAERVRGTPGAIGYVEFSYALKYNLVMAQLANREGGFVFPSDGGVRAALASANWSRPGYYELVTNRGGLESWPIVGVSFILVRKRVGDRDDLQHTLAFLDWIYGSGAALAGELHYVSLDDRALVGRIKAAWREIHVDARNAKGR